MSDISPDVLEALCKGFMAAVAASANPSFPHKLPGEVFDTIPQDQRYLEFIIIPNDTENEAWGDEKTYRGIIRLVLHWTVDSQGAYPPARYLKSVVDQLPKGKTFAAGAALVKLTQTPTVQGVLENGSELLFPATLAYSCNAP